VSLLAAVKGWARRIKRDVMTVYFASRDPETPLLVRLLALAIAAYALSPIDLIPDFIPVLGYLDDLLIVPAGIYLVIRLLPPHVIASSRLKAEAVCDRPKSYVAAVLIILVWLLILFIAILWFFRK
jgi:uncharacterized membrane protein YkvA (DUF1232 family)